MHSAPSIHDGKHCKVVVDGITYIGKIVGASETSGGLAFLLEFSTAVRIKFLRADCVETTEALTKHPRRSVTITSVVGSEDPPPQPAWPGIGGGAGSLPPVPPP